KTLGAEVVAGFLMVGTIAGILMAMFLNNAGGAWDNAKKYIETGAHGGKRSDPHKAAVVGDTVGDPFKDTAGPSLHVLIKLLSTLTLVLAPVALPRWHPNHPAPHLPPVPPRSHAHCRPRVPAVLGAGRRYPHLHVAHRLSPPRPDPQLRRERHRLHLRPHARLGACRR